MRSLLTSIIKVLFPVPVARVANGQRFPPAVPCNNCTHRCHLEAVFIATEAGRDPPTHASKVYHAVWTFPGQVPTCYMCNCRPEDEPVVTSDEVYNRMRSYRRHKPEPTVCA